jgi:hypothetical protein
MLYVLLVLVLVSFVIAFFSARTWHWGHVLVVEGVVLATLGFFLLAAEVLRINAVYRSEIKKQEKQLADATARNTALRKGTNDTAMVEQLRAEQTDEQKPAVVMAPEATSIPSLEDLDHELLIAARIRGRVWRNVGPAAPANPQTGLVTIAVPAPVPAGIQQDSVVYLFDDGEPEQPAANGALRGPQYLGEFRVTKVTPPQGQQPTQATLEPVLPMKPTDFELRRLAGSRGPWILYETMPMDRHEIFLGMPEDKLKQKLPKQTVNEYVRDGQPTNATDDPWHVVGFDENGNPLPPEQIKSAAKVLYRRRLRDYAAEFDDLARRRAVMLAQIDGIQKDIERLNVAQDVAKKIQAYREDEKQKLTSDLTGVKKEREAIEQHLAKLQQQLARARQLTAELLKHNKQMADELAARQLRPVKPGSGAASPAESTGPLAVGEG